MTEVPEIGGADGEAVWAPALDAVVKSVKAVNKPQIFGKYWKVMLSDLLQAREQAVFIEQNSAFC